MAAAVLALTPFAAASMLMPLWLIIEVQLLGSSKGLAKSIAFVSGMTLARLAQGALFLALASEASDLADDTATHWLVSAALLLFGLLLLIAGVRMMLGEPDSDAAPPRWAQLLESITPTRALGLGAGLVAINSKAWIFTLGALGVIAEADLDRGGQLGAYLLFIVMAQLLLLGLIVVSVVVPQQAAGWVAAISEWLQRNSRAISIGVALIFGSLFLFRGLTGLLA